MAFLTGIADLLQDPGGLWEILILTVFKFIGNYGWRILFFTVCLKLLLLPLDLYQRIKMRKNQIITERLKPQLEKLQQQYAGDKQTLAQKQMELNKKEGFSYFSSCLPMIVTLVIFFYLFAGLNNISQYKNLRQYVELYDAYTVVETQKKDEKFDVAVDAETKNVSWNELSEEQQALMALRPQESAYKDENGNWTDGGEDAYKAADEAWVNTNQKRVNDLYRAMENTYNANIRPAAQQAVVERYTGTGAYEGQAAKESFLWISNIWSPDVPWRKAILSHDQFLSNISDYSKYGEVLDSLDVDPEKPDKYGNCLTAATFADMISPAKYNNVTGALRGSDEYDGVNGFLILPILSVALSFLSQFITSRLQKQSGQAAPEGGMAGSMKMMMIIMPVMMGIFALSYTAMFTLYIVVNSTTTFLINVLTSLAMNAKSKPRENKQTTGIQKYGRPDPKDL